MIKSMTGFGSGEDENFKIEIKSLNHKYAEFNIHFPGKFFCVENLILEKLKLHINRGKIDVFINYNAILEEEIPLDMNMAKAYLYSWDKLSKLLNLENDIKLSDLVRIKEIYDSNETNNEKIINLWPQLEKLINIALNDLDQARIREGEKLLKDLKKSLRNMKRFVVQIESQAQEVPERYKEKFYRKLEELSLNLEEHKDRIALEIAFYVNRCDINEELVRIKGHLKEINNLLRRNESVGKKLEFICQELNREINTVGSKVGIFEISRKVIMFKGEIERFKEQMRNIE
ncbi:MAG: YicC/YloC family endoribonuclease [bacterium]|nr:YicC/YloC family endoribonuclease [bacterium]